MKIINVVTLLTILDITYSLSLENLQPRAYSGVNNVSHLKRRGYGPIAVACNFQSRLTAATTEPGFDAIMNDCNNAYTTLLVKDPSQQNAIALQNEIVYIKEQFSVYKNNYFLTHPTTPSSSSTASSSSTTTSSSRTSTSTSTPGSSTTTSSTTTSSSDPNPTEFPPGQTIFQRCNLENKIKNAQKRDELNTIYNSCGLAYNQLLNHDPSKVNELNTEWLKVQERIKRAYEEFKDPTTTNPPVTSTTTTGTTTTATTTPPVTTTTTTTTSSGPNPTGVPSGQTITQRCDLENNINKVAKMEQFDLLVNLCSKSYSDILTAYPGRINDLNSEWQTVVNRIQAAKVQFAAGNKPTSTATATATTPPVTTATATATTGSTTTITATLPTTTVTTTTTSSSPTPTGVPSGQTVTQRCDLENNISNVKKMVEFDTIVNSCSKAYSDILTAYPGRINDLNSEWQTVVNRIQAAKIAFGTKNPGS